MIYLLQHYFPPQRSLGRCLLGLEGLGPASVRRLCAQLGFSTEIPLGDLKAFQLDRLTQWVHTAYRVGPDLRALRTQERTRLLRMHARRAQRAARGLPCRGQRTHSNARTARRRLVLS